MFRNIYLENYKTNIQSNHTLENILVHFNHAYSTLGSILNDLEFAIGKILSSNQAKSERESNNSR